MPKLSRKNQVPVDVADIRAGQRLVLMESSDKVFAIPLGVTRHSPVEGGIDTSGATATANDVRKGKTGYAGNKRIIGTRVVRFRDGTFRLTGCAIEQVNGIYRFRKDYVTYKISETKQVTWSLYANDSGYMISSNTTWDDASLAFEWIVHRDEPFEFLYRGAIDKWQSRSEGYLWEPWAGAPEPPPRTTLYA